MWCRFNLPVAATAGGRERIEQRPAVHGPVVLIEGVDHRASVPPGRHCIGHVGIRLARYRVDGAWRGRVRPSPPWRLVGLSQPQRVISRLRPRRPVPRDLDRGQEPQPAQQFVAVGPQRGQRGIARRHLAQEVADRWHFLARGIDNLERHLAIGALRHPPCPRDHQLGDIPDRPSLHVSSSASRPMPITPMSAHNSPERVG